MMIHALSSAVSGFEICFRVNLRIDLSQQRSAILRNRDISEADLLLVMEHWHRVRILRCYPESKGKVFLIGTLSLSTGGKAQVADPFKKCAEDYDKCAIQLLNHCEAIAQNRRKN